MKIGDLARLTATPVETIRFYEREQLLPEPQRTAGNYRVYQEPHAQRLAFIRHCRSLDMTLDEIRVLLRLRDAPAQDCQEANQLLDDHIGHVAQRIRELRGLERQLKALRLQCAQGQPARDCGILNRLARDAQAPPQRGLSHGHVAASHRLIPG